MAPPPSASTNDDLFADGIDVDLPTAARSRPPLGALLRQSGRDQWRRVRAWLLATAATVCGALLIDPLGPIPYVAGAVGLVPAAWCARQAIGLRLAARDLLAADTPPRRAYVALFTQDSRAASRLLLFTWSQLPPPGKPYPKPESVWLCDPALDDLASHPGSVMLHEAWLDTGPRPRSKPRWVVADVGIAVVQRRSLLGRRRSRLRLKELADEPWPLTVGNPHTVPDTGQELPVEGNLVVMVLARTGLLAMMTALWAAMLAGS